MSCIRIQDSSQKDLCGLSWDQLARYYFVQWTAPPIATMKSNFDAPVSTSGAGVRFLLQDHTNQAICAASKKNLPLCCSLAELQAAWEALRFTIHTLQQTHNMREGDFMTVIS